MFDLDALSQTTAHRTGLRLGDLIWDACVDGGAPPIERRHGKTDIGVAADLAGKIAALGASRIFAGLVGEDAAGERARAEPAREARLESRLVKGDEDAGGLLVGRKIVEAAAGRAFLSISCRALR